MAKSTTGTAPRHHDIIHEGAVVIEAGTAHEPREQALSRRHRFDNQAAVARHQRQTFGPARRNVRQGQRLDERARHARTTVCDHVDLAEAGRRVIPVVERADRHLAPDRRAKADTLPPAARCRDLHVDQHPIDGRMHSPTASARARCESVSRPCRSSAGSSAGIITLSRLPHTRSEPQRRHRVPDRGVVSSLARHGLGRLRRRLRAQRPHRMLAMPACYSRQLVEKPALLTLPRRTVALRHRQHHLAPRAHADVPRHRRQRPDSLAQPQSWQDFFGNILDEAMRGSKFRAD
jgi:hypothetical protein